MCFMEPAVIIFNKFSEKSPDLNNFTREIWLCTWCLERDTHLTLFQHIWQELAKGRRMNFLGYSTMA